jgi:hypothetical protein
MISNRLVTNVLKLYYNLATLKKNFNYINNILMSQKTFEANATTLSRLYNIFFDEASLSR